MRFLKKEKNLITHDLKNLTDQSLMQKTEHYVREEREVLTNLLYHFKEIERRRLYCDYKYGSLHKMLVGYFGYSDDEAYRRTSAMRLISELPEVEEKINTGALSLSHLGLAQTFFRQEKKTTQTELSKTAMIEFLEKISTQPLREAQRIIYSQSSAPEQLRPERITVISQQKTEFRFTANAQVETKIQELKGLLAHKYPHLSLAELFEILCDMGLEKFKKEKAGARDYKAISTATPRKHCDKAVQANVNKTSFTQIKKQIWSESNCKCSQCGSTHALEVDHRQPRGKGGNNNKENLRLLCRACNQRVAIKSYGIHKMDKYIN